MDNISSLMSTYVCVCVCMKSIINKRIKKNIFNLNMNKKSDKRELSKNT